MADQKNQKDDRSPMAQAIDTASQVFTACLMMVLPGIGGFYLDKYLQTSIVFTVLGFLFGFAAGALQIMKIVQKRDSANDE